LNSEEYKYIKSIIGLDMSLTEPGWAKYNIEKKELTSGVIDVKQYKGLIRINAIVEAINDLYEDSIDTEHHLVILEGYSFGSKGAAVISIGELGGVVRYELWKNKTKYIEVAPTSAKKFLTGTGTAQKSVIIKEVYKKYNIDVNNDNEADAINLAYIGRAITKDPEIKLNKTQEEVINKITKEK
jgi:crossover junction endodeoxyribonuclease RuvC